MKGVHPILSHSVLLVISLVAMGMIIASLTASFSGTESGLLRAEIDYIAETARSEVLDIYQLASQSDYTNGTFELELPEKIGDKKYVLLLEDSKLKVRMPFENDFVEVEKTLNINAQLSGEASLPASLVVEKNGVMSISLVG